jgi:hypothetical protein
MSNLQWMIDTVKIKWTDEILNNRKGEAFRGEGTQTLSRESPDFS